MTDRPLNSLKLRSFSVTFSQTDYDRLTGWAIRNTISRSQMIRDIVHNWLDNHHAGLVTYYRHLAETQNKTVYAVETDILGQAKRQSRAKASVSSEEEPETIRVSMGLPSWDNRRLLGHAHWNEVSKAEQVRRIVAPWLAERDKELEIFWVEVAGWLECDIPEAKRRMIEDFENQGR